MKAGIITLFDKSNIGNRLQNYAVTNVLGQMGLECETLIPPQSSLTDTQRERESRIQTLFDNDPVSAQQIDPVMCRSLRVGAFNQQYIPTRVSEETQFGSETERAYDFFITGSDQVWNPTFKSARGQMRNRLLAFAPPEKRICFAPSIGMESIPLVWHQMFADEWARYRRLSVRENEGAELIYELTGRRAEVVIDPTLMIKREQWKKLAKPLPGFSKPQGYVLYFLLGKPEEELSAETKAALDREMKRKGLDSLQLFDETNPALNAAGPQEVLDLIQDATLICTDSYHGTVFSILFGKPFILVNRVLQSGQKNIDMSSRMRTLLGKLDLEERLPEKQVLHEEGIWQIDYPKAYALLEKERTRASRFLRVSLGLERPL